MHAIFLRGRNEPIVVDDMIGRELKTKWVEGHHDDEKIEIEGVSTPIKAIYRVENNWQPSRDRVAERDHNKRFYGDERRRYEECIRNLRAKPPEDRARNLDVARMIWYAVTGTHDMPRETEAAIIERQRYFFLDNPGDAYASPIWYRDLLPFRHDGYGSALRPMRHQARDNAFLLAERVLQASNRVR